MWAYVQRDGHPLNIGGTLRLLLKRLQKMSLWYNLLSK